MNEPDPLAETDIYASEKKEEEAPINTQTAEDLDMEDDIGSVLDKSFKTEKNKTTLV